MLARIFLILLSLTVFVSSKIQGQTNNPNEVLWYTYPAEYWNSQSLHLGNGFFGASFFGGVEEETFALTEASMWTGEPAKGRWQRAGVNPKAKEVLPDIREAVLNGNGQKADSLITEDFFGSSELFGHFTSIGNLMLEFKNHDGPLSHYKRSLDLASSTGRIEYTIDNIEFSREYFSSYPDRILAMKFTADKPGKISFDLTMDIIQDSSKVEINENVFRVRGYINGNQRPFEVLIHVANEGGTVSQEGKALTVRNADTVKMYTTTATNYQLKYPDYTGEDPEVITERIIEDVISKNYDELKASHQADYKKLYDRVNLKLPSNEEAEALPTNERFKRLRSGKSDPGYKTLAFNLGRYMVISSSRPKTLPANLQGVWNAFLTAPWAGNYQSNINLQEIYWSSGPTNLIETQEPYIKWIEDLAKSGREIAQRVYGTDGWVSHTTGNIWGHAAPIGGHPWGMYPVGAAWHAQHVWDHYRFTQDEEYLKNQAYPLLKGASQFWLQNLISFKGYLITAPTVSAEHGALKTEDGLKTSYHDFQSDKYVYSLPGVYQDIQMIWDLFSNTAKAATILGENKFSEKLLDTRSELLPLKIGQYGQLQEWYQDIDAPDGHHRHIAHLYTVCPGNQIHPTTTPELAKAAKKSINMRGDGRFLEQELATGGNWSRAHRMCAWTRLMDGNRANKIMTEMLTEQGFENGLTFQHADYDMGRSNFYTEDGLFLHFQLDGSAALPGILSEMLLQSHMGEIHLLPALPDEFHTGKVRGLKARGGYTVDIKWVMGEVEHVNIHTYDDGKLPSIRIKDRIVDPESASFIEILNTN